MKRASIYICTFWSFIWWRIIVMPVWMIYNFIARGYHAFCCFHDLLWLFTCTHTTHSFTFIQVFLIFWVCLDFESYKIVWGSILAHFKTFLCIKLQKPWRVLICFPAFLHLGQKRHHFIVRYTLKNTIIVIVIIINVNQKLHVSFWLCQCSGIQLCYFHWHINHLFNKQASVN